MADVLPDPDLWTMKEAAVVYRVGINTAYKLAKAGLFPGAFRDAETGRWKVSKPRYRQIVHGSEVPA